MPDDPIEEITEPGPVELPDHDIRPPWVDELLTAVERIPDAIAEALPQPAAPEVELPAEEPTTEDPAPDTDDKDESPVSVPWTHKIPFRH